MGERGRIRFMRIIVMYDLPVGEAQVLRLSEASFCSMLTLCGIPSDEGHLVTGEDFIVL